MKIAICINGRPHEGGMTTVVNTTAKALRERGHQVDVITIFGVSPYRKVKQDLTVYVDNTLKNKPFLSILIYFASKAILAFYIYFNFFLKGYNAILAMDMSVANISYPLKKFFKVPILNFPLGAISELIDQGKMSKDSWAFNYLKHEEKKALERSSINIGSAFHLKHVEQVNANPAPFTFLHCAPLDPQLFYKPDKITKEAIRKRMGVTSEKFLLLFVGRLAPRKGPDYLLSAFEKIIKKNNNYLLFYVGTGPEEKNLKDKVEKFGLNAVIKFFGSIPHENIADFYKMANCFIFPTYIKDGINEPFSNTVIEAMSCGLPIVAFDTVDSKSPAQYRRVLRDNDNCLLVPQKDVASLAKAIESLYNNHNLLQKLSINAINEIESGGYKASYFAKELETIIHQKLESFKN